ncbi:MAG: sugar nucleotide-binding protein [bacterium]
MFLIVGASGFVGNKLYIYFKNKGQDVKGTYYLKTFEDGIYLNLNEADFSRILELKNLTHIFLCNGITNIDECKINREVSYRINVINTIKLLENFIEKNVVSVYLSTDMVYKGDIKFYKESNGVSPITEYGRQKVEVENYIMKTFKRYIILRLTKIFGIEKDDKTLFTSWLELLRGKKTIFSADDVFISPIFIMDVVHSLDRLVSGRHYGIFNLGGCELLTRYELSKRLANFFGYDLSLIQRKSIKSFGFVEPRPLFSSVDSSKIIELTGTKLTPLENCFKLMVK